MIRVVSFDVDGTMVLPDFNSLIWFEVLPRLYADKKGLDLEDAKEEMFSEYEGIGPNDLRWYSLDFWLKFFGLDYNQNHILEEHAHEVVLYDDVVSSLESLFGKYDLVVSSGMPDDFIEIKLRKNDIKRFFKRTFSSISQFELVRKDESFYTRVCQELEIEPGQLIHIGDHYQADYLAPIECGALAFYLDRGRQKEKHLGIVYSLEEFVKKLETGGNPEL